MRARGLVITVAAWMGLLQSSEAVLSEKFALDFTGGALAGETVVGEVSWDDSALTGAGFEELGPIGGALAPGGVLSFDVTIGSDAFSIGDADGFPDLPILAFSDGELVDIEYITDFLADPFLEVFLGGVSYFPASGEPSFGTYRVGIDDGASGVPDAGFGAMAFAALFGGVIALRRYRS